MKKNIGTGGNIIHNHENILVMLPTPSLVLGDFLAIFPQQRNSGIGTEVLRAKYPCLLTVEKANFRPRIPNLKRWKASRTAPIAVYSAATIPGLDPAQIGDPGSPTKVPRTYPPEVGAKGSMIDEGSTEKNVDRLFGLIADVL